jgi:hypothetical protein
MEDNTEQAKQGDPQIEDLPNKESSDDAQNAENVKGGRATRGHDDDLDDLEVER